MGRRRSPEHGIVADVLTALKVGVPCYLKRAAQWRLAETPLQLLCLPEPLAPVVEVTLNSPLSGREFSLCTGLAYSRKAVMVACPGADAPLHYAIIIFLLENKQVRNMNVVIHKLRVWTNV